MTRPLVVMAVLALVGCGGGGGGAHDAAAPEDSSPPLDGGGEPGDGPREDAPPPDDGPLVGPISGSLAVDFTANVTGDGTTRLGEVSVVANVVDYTLLGVAHQGVAYEHHVWTSAGYTLYDVLSIAADGSNLAVTYLYCDGTALPYAYTESFTLAMGYEAATGTCDATGPAATVAVALPALAVRPVAMDTGITIEGLDLQLDATGGWIKLANETWDLVPFNTVDCSDCEAGNPWYEIHSMLMRPAEACFGILYLYPDAPGTVQLSYTLCLPTLDRPDAVYTAAWSGTPLARQRATPRFWRPAAPPAWRMREAH